MARRNIKIDLRLNEQEMERLRRDVARSGWSREKYLRALIEHSSIREIPSMDLISVLRNIDMDDGTMGMDMIGAVNCAAMVGAAANAHAISVLWYNYLIHQSVPIFGKRNYRDHKVFKPMQ